MKQFVFKLFIFKKLCAFLLLIFVPFFCLTGLEPGKLEVALAEVLYGAFEEGGWEIPV